MEKTNFILSAIVAALLFLSAADAKAQTTERVRFANGATSATFRGVLKGQTQRYSDYVVRADAGQTIDVQLVGKTEAHFVILKPETLVNLSLGGKEWLGELPGGNERIDEVWSRKLPKSGDYVILVSTLKTRNTNFKLQVSIR